MKTKILISGFGGQGILFAGHLLAEAAMIENKHVSWVPSYGPEMRGGTAYCSIIISDKEISSPIVDQPEILIAFNQPSQEKFGPLIVPGGLVIANSSLIPNTLQRTDVHQYRLAANAVAEQLGTIKAVNMIMLGAFLNLDNSISSNTIKMLIHQRFERKNHLKDLNLTALKMGKEKIVQVS